LSDIWKVAKVGYNLLHSIVTKESTGKKAKNFLNLWPLDTSEC